MPSVFVENALEKYVSALEFAQLRKSTHQMIALLSGVAPPTPNCALKPMSVA